MTKMKRLLALVFVPLLSFGAETRPNIVLILSDDQAWTDYGFMGHPEIKTPHLDKLASRSLVFERGYVASPLCRPSLASLLTGRFPHDHGVTGNDVDGNKDREALDLPVRESFHKLPSFVRMLTANGYLAHQSGKWWEGTHTDGGFTDGMMPKPARHGNTESLAIGRDGIKPVTDFIDRATAEKKPFFVWYAPFLPHTPHNPPKRLLERYQKPGRVILYICDNGWVPASANANDPHQKTWKGYALRSKGSPYEYGIRTPIMVSWPGKVSPERSPEFAHTIDFFPTIAALAGLKAPDGLTGVNLLDKPSRKSRETVFGVTHSIHNMTPGDPDGTLQYHWCIKDEWKLIVRHHGKDSTDYRKVHQWDKAPVRLYQIRKDPHEENDLAAGHPDIVERLRGKISAWHTVKENQYDKR
jgi:arylsulfatase A-like enzyme